MDKRTNKRNKEWRKKKKFYHYKARLLREATEYISDMSMANGGRTGHPHWFELTKEHWTQCYKTTSTPCSCFLCKGERHSRLQQKKEDAKIIHEELKNLNMY